METDQNLNVMSNDPTTKGRRFSDSTINNSSTSAGNDKSCLKSIGIEPVMLFQGIANSGLLVIVQNFYLDRICRNSFNISNEICMNLTHNAIEEKLVESRASEYTMYQSLIEYGFPIILALFLGPWTDKNGNKPVIILSLLGYALSALLYIVFYFFPQLPPAYILISSIPIAISGGVVTFVISTYSFMMKQTDLETRSFRLSALSIIWDFGGLIGCLAGAKIFEYWGFLAVFIFGGVFYATALLYTCTIVTEEIPERLDLIRYESNSTCDLFDISALKETLHTCFKKRQGNRRMWILVLMVCLSLQLLMYCVKTFQYLFTRNKFGWDTETYSDFAAANTMLGTVGGAFVILGLIKLLRLTDIVIVILNCISNLSANFLFAFSKAGWQMYLGSGVQMFGSITTAVIRSMLSKCVPKDEHGRLLSFVTCVELSMPFVAGPLYGLVYMNTVSLFPGSIFLVAAGLTSVMLVSFIFLYFSMRNQVNYEVLIEE